MSRAADNITDNLCAFTIPQQRVHDAIAGVTIDFLATDPPQIRVWRHADALLAEDQRRDIVFDMPDRTPGSFGTLLSPCPPSREEIARRTRDALEDMDR